MIVGFVRVNTFQMCLREGVLVVYAWKKWG